MIFIINKELLMSLKSFLHKILLEFFEDIYLLKHFKTNTNNFGPRNFKFSFIYLIIALSLWVLLKLLLIVYSPHFHLLEYTSLCIIHLTYFLLISESVNIIFFCYVNYKLIFHQIKKFFISLSYTNLLWQYDPVN